MGLINVRIAKLQTYGTFRVTDRVWSQHVRITDIPLYAQKSDHKIRVLPRTLSFMGWRDVASKYSLAGMPICVAWNTYHCTFLTIGVVIVTGILNILYTLPKY